MALRLVGVIGAIAIVGVGLYCNTFIQGLQVVVVQRGLISCSKIGEAPKSTVRTADENLTASRTCDSG